MILGLTRIYLESVFFAWASDNQTFSFINYNLGEKTIDELLVNLSEPIWQTYNVETQTLSEGQTYYPLQPILSNDEIERFNPSQFILPSSDGRLLAFSSVNDSGDYVLTFADRITGEVILTPIITYNYMFFSKGYWSQTGYNFIWLESSVFTPSIEYVHIQLNLDPSLSTIITRSVITRSDSIEPIEGYDRILDLSEDGNQILSIGRQSTSALNSSKITVHLPYLIISYPGNIIPSVFIKTFSGDDICNAAFTSDGENITLLMSYGRVILYNLVQNTLSILAVNVPQNCYYEAVFSSNGAWVALIELGTGLRFINITGLLSQASSPLTPPVAHAGSDQILVDYNGDGFETTIINGNLSSDSDGYIVSYAWGRGVSTFPEGIVQTIRFEVGQTTYELTVTDNNGLQDVDEITIILEPAQISP